MSDGCANTKCKWHRREGGCKLFDGQAWTACRKSRKDTTKPTTKPQKGKQ